MSQKPSSKRRVCASSPTFPSRTSPSVNVKRLSIQLSNDFTALGDLARTLHSFPNLRALEITPPQPRPWMDVLVRTRQKPDFLAFLREQQPEIEELRSFDTSGDVVTVQVHMLPRLEKFRSTVPRFQFDPVPEKGASQRVVHVERMDVKIQLGSEFVREFTGFSGLSVDPGNSMNEKCRHPENSQPREAAWNGHYHVQNIRLPPTSQKALAGL
ncbi:hypothetical protein K438DRAFT_1768437 [Mycena galopus ATCC 62051]|nr:hypothetical protein K438DRAFT_1768437 [Mycena galopus ATCC 62051]